MKPVNPHRDGLEPLSDIVPLSVVEPTAQLVPKEGSQVATAINQKLSV